MNLNNFHITTNFLNIRQKANTGFLLFKLLILK